MNVDRRVVVYVRLLLLLLLSWCAMTSTHELGHLVGGWFGGGALREVELRPWRLPHSRFSPNPHPLITLWSGPLLGILVPLLVAAVVRRPWMWFVANFCLLANGAYLALAWITGDRLLDTSRLLDAGARPWSILLFCVATISVGYYRFRRSVIEQLELSQEPIS